MHHSNESSAMLGPVSLPRSSHPVILRPSHLVQELISALEPELKLLLDLLVRAATAGMLTCCSAHATRTRLSRIRLCDKQV